VDSGLLAVSFDNQKLGHMKIIQFNVVQQKVAGQVGIVYLCRLLKIIPSDLDRIFYQDGGKGSLMESKRCQARRVPFARLLNELCLSSPSDVMPQLDLGH
jgi:hypothetical protein